MQPALKLILILLLGFWIGASVFLTFASAPVVFQLAKQQVITRDQAGDIAEHTLKKYFLWGTVVVGAALLLSLLLAFTTGRPRWYQSALVLLIVLILIIFTGFVWTPKVHKVRMERRSNPSVELDKRFGKMHGISMVLNLLAIVGTAGAFVIVAKTE